MVLKKSPTSLQGTSSVNQVFGENDFYADTLEGRCEVSTGAVPSPFLTAFFFFFLIAAKLSWFLETFQMIFQGTDYFIVFSSVSMQLVSFFFSGVFKFRPYRSLSFLQFPSHVVLSSGELLSSNSRLPPSLSSLEAGSPSLISCRVCPEA